MTVLSARRSPAPGRRREVTTSSLNWLRAGVLGANDGIVSIAATVLGVAGASTPVRTIAVAGIAALVAGALSMAAGEYVSVSSQRDAERAAVRRGRVLPTLVVRGGEELTNPWHAAVASLGAFVAGGLIPLVVVLAPWGAARVPATFAAVVVALALTGLVAARFSGAEPRRAVLRNIVGGSVAMAVTFAVGAFVGVAL
ncbi:VIT1/CCC1 transporter family protein [Cellulomonas fengjieae]|uniref:VIT1/CCC1 transporter family protein n=1 Tax=Cellulomonas fengjieae TaxID=2819978 RepID=A0ABS3SGF6_9CELL|nr:VIT1/CCC1 transporter family protein [Cellulomonas fengjieae]MBO3084035.1 VIT1/CCC1 transporter family protein [Cellulomonas fengjieae]QVI64706.1 VIT1/CCC1 transporter family protein [Cellulomonas fengjieae]